MAFTEIRTYEIFEGKMDEWVTLMTQEIVPFQTEVGMKITGLYRGEDDTRFVWTRDFDSEAVREAQYAAVYQSDRWKNEIGPRVRQCIDLETMKVVRGVKV